MKKGFALVLILALMSNTVLWADEYDFLEDPGFIALAVGLAVLPLLIWWMMSAIDGTAEAEAPDDGIRLVSTQNPQPMLQTNSVPVMDVLQHVVFDYNVQENNWYLGLRFRF